MHSQCGWWVGAQGLLELEFQVVVGHLAWEFGTELKSSVIVASTAKC